MKVIRHAGVDSRMIILDDQARQQMTLHFQLSLQCNVSPITGFVRHTVACLIVQNNHPTTREDMSVHSTAKPSTRPSVDQHAVVDLQS